jgi:signal transduction histidine kinase
VDVTSISLAAIAAPVAACTSSGILVGATPSASALLERLPMRVRPLPQPLPAAFWRELCATPPGEAMQWLSPAEDEARLGCTRYALGSSHFLLLMREVTEKQRVLAQRLHRQRLEATGRLVAGIAHDVRNSLSAIVFNVEMLDERTHEPDAIRQSLAEIRAATISLRRTVDGLLDFARLGPPRNADVSLLDVYNRVMSLLRGMLRGSPHVFVQQLDPAVRVKANVITLEQVLVNLIVNALEANPAGARICVTCEPVAIDGTPRFVKMRVMNEGSRIPPGVHARLFEPFFTTKEHGTGLGLAVSREALRDLGGDLVYEPVDENPAFSLLIPGVD